MSMATLTKNGKKRAKKQVSSPLPYLSTLAEQTMRMPLRSEGITTPDIPRHGNNGVQDCTNLPTSLD